MELGPFCSGEESSLFGGFLFFCEGVVCMFLVLFGVLRFVFFCLGFLGVFMVVVGFLVCWFF